MNEKKESIYRYYSFRLILYQTAFTRVYISINDLFILIYSLRDPLENMLHEDFFRLIAKYKFAIAIENALCDDYVTEKFWRPLHVGTIPIVLGSPKIKVGKKD